MSFTAAATMAMFGKENRPLRDGIIVSCLLHLCILVGIPVFLQIVRGSVSFERPPTFQLVNAPPSLRPVKPLVQRRAKAPADESSKPEENLNELASVLDEIPAPARIATTGDFKYNWYLENIQQKISRYWNPPSEDRSISVVVSFTIHGDGSISEPAVSTPSGNGSLDNLAVRAVRLASPFGKLPPGFSGEKLELSCTLIPVRN